LERNKETRIFAPRLNHATAWYKPMRQHGYTKFSLFNSCRCLCDCMDFLPCDCMVEIIFSLIHFGPQVCFIHLLALLPSPSSSNIPWCHNVLLSSIPCLTHHSGHLLNNCILVLGVSYSSILVLFRSFSHTLHFIHQCNPTNTHYIELSHISTYISTIFHVLWPK
jgi:hypothetical protein